MHEFLKGLYILCINVKELHICFSVLKIKLCEIEIEIQAWEPSVAQGTHNWYPNYLNLIKTFENFILGMNCRYKGGGDLRFTHIYHIYE